MKFAPSVDYNENTNALTFLWFIIIRANTFMFTKPFPILRRYIYVSQAYFYLTENTMAKMLE